MNRWISAALCAAGFFAAARPADAFLFVSGSNARSGDLVAVWVKNGFELIVNLGPVEGLGLGTLTSFAVPAEFDGTLADAKFTALAVPNPKAVFSGLGIDPPLVQNNIAFTTLADPGTIGFYEIGNAQASLDPPVTSQTWFTLLGSIPAAGQTGVVSNTNTEALIQTTLFASYTGNIGFSSDAIANQLTLSTATFVAGGSGYGIPLYEVFQIVELVGQDFNLSTEITTLGMLTGDDGSSGNAILSLENVPEPGETALGVVALAALVWVQRCRARS
jgi:hypothetical protein